jgi:hypothetical protein
MPPPRKQDRVKKLHKASKAEKKAARSRGGFLFAAAAVAGMVAAAIWCGCAPALCASCSPV